jgi:hypothetical protein
LLDLKVSLDELHRFSNDVVHVRKMTLKEDYAAWSTGVATGLLTSPVLHILGPVVGYYAGKSVQKRVVVTKSEGEIRRARWYEVGFATMERGDVYGIRISSVAGVAVWWGTPSRSSNWRPKEVVGEEKNQETNSSIQDCHCYSSGAPLALGSSSLFWARRVIGFRRIDSREELSME